MVPTTHPVTHQTAKQNGVALVAGVLFGLGLGLSQMIDRDLVLGFLDVAGLWDPTLLFVLGGAVGVTLVTFQVVLRRSRPLWAESFSLPSKQQIDRPLLLGAALFGVGWGIAGYCPGPAITALVLVRWYPIVFVMAMVAGFLAYGWISSRFKI
jgi:hypothetical protein